jgi:hypothetical protein
MPDVWTLIGWILTVVFGITSLIQFLEDRARSRNLMALRATIDSMVELSIDALRENREKPNPDKMLQTIHALFVMSRGLMESLGTMLPRQLRK